MVYINSLVILAISMVILQTKFAYANSDCGSYKPSLSTDIKAHKCLNKIEVEKYGQVSVQLKGNNLIATDVAGNSIKVYSINLRGDISKSFTSTIENGICRTITGVSNVNPVLLLNPKSKEVQEGMVARLGKCIKIYYEDNGDICKNELTEGAINQIKSLIPTSFRAVEPNPKAAQ